MRLRTEQGVVAPKTFQAGTLGPTPLRAQGTESGTPKVTELCTTIGGDDADKPLDNPRNAVSNGA